MEAEMSENTKWLEARKKSEQFRATPIGSAFMRFDSALANAWIADTRDSDGFGKSLDKAWAKEKAARTELLKLLYEAAGVGEYDDGK